jgi:hypothetical protein
VQGFRGLTPREEVVMEIVNNRGDRVGVLLRGTATRPIRLLVQRKGGGFVTVGFEPEMAEKIADALKLGAMLESRWPGQYQGEYGLAAD